MASRRVRIKGIANIPQRRKNITESNDNEHQEQNNINSNKSEEITQITEHNLNVVPDSHGCQSNVIDNRSNICNKFPVETAKENIQSSDGSLSIVKKDAQISSLVEVPQNKVNLIENKYTENCTVIATTNNTLIEKKTQNDKVPNVRRKFLKPPVSINLVNRKVKQEPEGVKAEPNKENVQECANLNLNEVEISESNTNSSIVIQKAELVEPLHQKLVSETAKLLPKSSAKPNLDIEYQHQPTSPTKILNRRIKAIPKLPQRRTSFSIGSASESEDDSRRSYSRIRNDSVCSVASGINECQTTNEATSPVRKDFSSVQRKCRKTEQTRKFAEARREFNMKFNNGKPDKQKLTMIDLIFYNPATSPMSYNKRKRKSTTSSEFSDTKSLKDSKLIEEKADDLQTLSESDNEVPAPQIKVGPNGEIVVDEKSLIIENSETKRGREALQMSEVVNGDEDTSYGIYKRIKRSKDWTKDETLRFYKALNTIGTDFTMMCELFPNRTRRELKMKFKKEERLNQTLIDKALMQPTDFDMTELRKDLEYQGRKAEENKKRAEETKLMKAAINEHRKNMKRNEKLKEKGLQDSTQATIRRGIRKKKKTPYEAIKSGINGVLSDSDDDVSETKPSLANDNCSESDESNENTEKNNVFNILKPTRYGRVPKTRAYDLSNISVEQTTKKRKLSDNNSNEPKKDLEPGSIMIVKSKTPSDKVVYKVYFVTDNQTKQQIKLEPNMLENLTAEGIDRQYNENKLCDIEAHNIFTISAQECSDNVEQEISNVSSRSNTLNIQQLKNNKFILSGLTENSRNPVKDSNEINITSDSIIFPFDECLTPTAPNQNITVSHEENKMIVVTEDNKKCVLTT